MLRQSQRLWVSAFRSFGPAELTAAARKAGIARGDAVMLHSAFAPEHGFTGSSADAIDAFLSAVGPTGDLLMVSLPYRTSTRDYLERQPCFDVRRTPSAMGLMSEYFRRRPDVNRSLSPTHPVLALGPRSGWFVARHEDCVHPCGPDTPFARLLEADAQFAFFNVGFECLTFFHHLEHRVHQRLPFPLYTEAPYDVAVIDQAGQSRRVRTYAFGAEAMRRRRFAEFEGWVRARGLIREVRVGASRLQVARAREIANAVDDMAARGVFFYAMDESA
jgi:aminoglycoside 3-N-acetyltransferase